MRRVMRTATTSYVACAGAPGGPGESPVSRAGKLLVVAHAAEAAGRGVLDLRADVARQQAAPARDGGIEDLAHRHGLAERESLPRLAAEREQRVALLVELDALGHGVETERVGQREDGLRECDGVDAIGAAIRARQSLDERAVDLEDVDRKTMQIGER